jgi:membrane protease YdiL (CAAX protease family)
MTPRSLWLRLLTGTIVALVLVLAVPAPVPARRIASPFAVVAGIAAGALLYAVAVRARFGATHPLPRSVRTARLAIFGVLAANEEVVWRRVGLGLLLPRGLLIAVAGSTLAFALAHRRRRGLQLLTGAMFGGVYVATGSLAASIGAHWAYNELVARARAPTVA